MGIFASLSNKTQYNLSFSPINKIFVIVMFLLLFYYTVSASGNFLFLPGVSTLPMDEFVSQINRGVGISS